MNLKNRALLGHSTVSRHCPLTEKKNEKKMNRTSPEPVYFVNLRDNVNRLTYGAPIKTSSIQFVQNFLIELYQLTHPLGAVSSDSDQYTVYRSLLTSTALLSK